MAKLPAAKALADLGTEYHEEAARELLLLTDNPLAMEWNRVDAAGKLASLGPRYRDSAVAVLRRKLADHAVDADERVSAARELIAIGTEFHDEAAVALWEIAMDPTEVISPRSSQVRGVQGASLVWLGSVVVGSR